MYGDSQKVHVLHRRLVFQGKQRYLLFLHNLMQIAPGGIDPFAADVVPLIKHVIQNLDAEMGHADFVDVRKAQGKTDCRSFWIFFHHIDFVADIAGRLVNVKQYFIA